MCDRDRYRRSRALPLTSELEECAFSSRSGGSSVLNTGGIHRHKVAESGGLCPSYFRAERDELALKAFPEVPNSAK